MDIFHILHTVHYVLAFLSWWSLELCERTPSLLWHSAVKQDMGSIVTVDGFANSRNGRLDDTSWK